MLSVPRWSPTACEICSQFVQICKNASSQQENDCLNPNSLQHSSRSSFFSSRKKRWCLAMLYQIAHELIYAGSVRHAQCPNKTDTDQTEFPLPLWIGVIWSMWQRWKNCLIINNLGSRVIRGDPILLLLPLPHIPSIFSLRHFQFCLCFYSSTLTVTSKCQPFCDVVLSALLDLSTPHLLPPRLPSFIPAFIRPEPISTFASTVPRSPSLDSLHRSSSLCYFKPLRFSSSHHHIHSSIPQLLALRTSAIINLVQP